MKKVTILVVLFFGLTCRCDAHSHKICSVEKRSFDVAATKHTRAENRYISIQRRVDRKYDWGEDRRSYLKSEIAMAKGDLKAAQQRSAGQGIGCLLSRRRGCIGGTISRVANQIARAKQKLIVKEARLDDFVLAFRKQMTRLSARVDQAKRDVDVTRLTMDTKERQYYACMRG